MPIGLLRFAVGILRLNIIKQLRPRPNHMPGIVPYHIPAPERLMDTRKGVIRAKPHKERHRLHPRRRVTHRRPHPQRLTLRRHRNRIVSNHRHTHPATPPAKRPNPPRPISNFDSCYAPTFPRHGKQIPDFSMLWKIIFHTMENSPPSPPLWCLTCAPAIPSRLPARHQFYHRSRARRPQDWCRAFV